MVFMIAMLVMAVVAIALGGSTAYADSGFSVESAVGLVGSTIAALAALIAFLTRYIRREIRAAVNEIELSINSRIDVLFDRLDAHARERAILARLDPHDGEG